MVAKPDLFITRSAYFDRRHKYRYTLTRRWGKGEMFPCILLNPSIADEEQDDPTITRVISRAKRLKYSGIMLGNLFALCSTDPMELYNDDDPIGPDNDRWLKHIAEEANANSVPVMVAWGTGYSAYGNRANKVLRMLTSIGTRLVCLGTNEDNSPKHPLYLRSDIPLIPYKTPFRERLPLEPNSLLRQR